MASILPDDAMIYAHDLWVDTSKGELLAEDGDPPPNVE